MGRITCSTYLKRPLFCSLHLAGVQSTPISPHRHGPQNRPRPLLYTIETTPLICRSADEPSKRPSLRLTPRYLKCDCQRPDLRIVFTHFWRIGRLATCI